MEVLGENLGVGASRLSSNRGAQFGSSEKDCYVTVFDNGSIVSRGIMGLDYGVDTKLLIRRFFLVKLQKNLLYRIVSPIGA